MELDPDDVFRDDEEDADNEFYRVFTFSLFISTVRVGGFEFWYKHYFLGQEKESTKELLVYLVDASPKMFSTSCPSVSFLTCPPHQFDDSVFLIVDFGIVGWQGDQKDETHFQIAVSCISQSLKTQIINRSYDEVAICFFNTVR